MKSAQIPTSSLELNLIEPDVKRDAPLSLQWLSGEAGGATLTLMGVPETEIATPTLEIEKQRIRDFLTDTDQLDWMIEYKGTVVGSIWRCVWRTNSCCPGRCYARNKRFQREYIS